MGQWPVFSLFDQSQAEGSVSPQTCPFFDDHFDAIREFFNLVQPCWWKKEISSDGAQ